MSVESERQESQHPFFHTMVVMGSALALGCGGMSNPVEPERTASGGSGGGGSGGGGAVSGGTGGTGGTSGGGTGGSLVIIQGGSGGQSAVEPGPFKCSPSQWACPPSYPLCHGEGYRLPPAADCTCDEARPKTPADCAEGQAMVCRRATVRDDSVPFTEAVPFSCECATVQNNCGFACDMTFPEGGDCYSDVASGGRSSVLCGCASIVLR